MDKEKILKAGKIAKEVKIYAKTIVKKGTPLLEIAEKIESKILELGGKPAFPCNLSINNIAAHYTPSHDDKTIAHGLLKVDFGIHVEGWVADTAFSLDLENSEINKKLIETSEKALAVAEKSFKEKIFLNEIGEKIQKEIESKGFSPITNLSGHEIKQYDLHAGAVVPNISNTKKIQITKGLYAVEPFATNGSGRVHDGKPSGIYSLIKTSPPRNTEARKLLEFIDKEYRTLPFCSRWIVKKFGIKSLISLSQLERNENLHQYAHLVESEGSLVSQSENTILVDKESIVTT